MKFTKRSRWIIVSSVLAVLSLLFLTQVDEVRATIGAAHAFKVFLRVETEIMQKTPAGQYYESLFWKHNDELMRIMRAHPEHNEEFLRAYFMFVPELEALLNGDGDKVYISSEDVESLKAELDWHTTVGSPALREDIQREQQRLPLDALVGMTMNEALDFINSAWHPESVMTKTLVPDSDGRWAYYVHNGVYLEYPGSYYLQVSETEKDYIYFVPFQGSPEQWDPWVMKVHVWNVHATEKDAASSLSWYAPESIVWQGVIQTPEFQGVEFVSTQANTDMDIHAFQYNPENQLAVDISVFVFEMPQMDGSLDYSEMVNQKFEYFQHMIDSLRIQKP